MLVDEARCNNPIGRNKMGSREESLIYWVGPPIKIPVFQGSSVHRTIEDAEQAKSSADFSASIYEVQLSSSWDVDATEVITGQFVLKSDALITKKL